MTRHHRVDVSVLLDRARSVAEAGELDVARKMLLRRIFDEPGDLRLRMALAEASRAAGIPSEAARWGIARPGWATEREVRDLRRWLLGHHEGGDEVRSLLKFPQSAELPAELRDLVAPERQAPTQDRSAEPGDSAGCAALVITAMAVLAVVISLGWVFVAAVFDADDVRATAITAGMAMLFAGAFAGVALLIAAALDRLSRVRPGARTLTTVPTARPSMVETPFAVDLAWRLFERGDEREALILLRNCVRRNASNEVSAARAALTEMARARGRADQAARWGAPIAGISTAAERQAYANALSGPGAVRRLRRYSELGDHEPLGADVRDVLNRVPPGGGVARARGTGGAPERDQDEAALDRWERWDRRVSRISIVFLAVIGIALMTVFVVALIDGELATPVAHVSFAVSGAILIIVVAVERIAGRALARLDRRGG